MLGAIIGDIVGSVYEWSNIKYKNFDFFDPYGMPTDDSVMTLAVAKSLIEVNGNYDNLKDILIKNMVDLGRKYHDCGFGGHFYEWIMSDNHEPYNSYGNGAAMRISPVGFAGNNLEEVKEISKIITCVSHNHPESVKAAECVSCLIYLARTGKSKEELIKFINDNYYKIDFTLDSIRETYKFDVSCQGSVPQALEAFIESNGYEDAIRNAISIGGDSDTIAAITGGIASAFYGIPENIRKQSLKYLEDDMLEILYNFENKFENRRNVKNNNVEKKINIEKENNMAQRIDEDILWKAAEKLRDKCF